MASGLGRSVIAGAAIGFSDDDYRAAGAQLASVEELFKQADMIVKVKEPQLKGAPEFAGRGQILFTYLHLARSQQTKICSIRCYLHCYETVTDGPRQLPLLAPMSEVAGRMAIYRRAGCLEKARRWAVVCCWRRTRRCHAASGDSRWRCGGSNALAMAGGAGRRVT